MFAGAYTFKGDTEELKAAHAEMLRIMGIESAYLHVAIVGDGTLTVIDACPSEEVFDQFSSGEFFKSVRDKVGLPDPVAIEKLGEVVAAFADTSL